MFEKIRELIIGVILNYFPNNLINKIPIYSVRHLYYKKIMKIKIGKGSSIHLNTTIRRLNMEVASIGENSVINRESYIDFAGGLEIGNNVSISSRAIIITADHIPDSHDFKFRKRKVIIEDWVWVGTGAILLPGIKVGEGAIIAAGSIVTKNVEPYSIVGGNPAKFIRNRGKQLDYNCKFMPFFN